MNVSGVRKMFEMASKMKNPIDLSLGLPDFDVPDDVKKEAISSIKKGLNQYTQTTGIKELKQKILEKLRKENNIIAEEEQVIVTSAASGALSIVFTTIINEGDEIILFEPYFVAYKELIIQNGGVPVYARTKDDFSLDLEELKRKISNKTIAIVINSPNNPAGKVYTENELKNLAKIAAKYNLLIISDEIYEKFCYEKKYFSIGSIYPNTLTINGFSKSHAMTGWRVGYVAGPKEIITEAIKVQQFNFVCAPTPFQYAAIKAFDSDITKHISEYKKKRDIIFNGLKKEYKIAKPEGAFYAFVKYPCNPEKFMENCIKNNLLVVPGSAFSQHNTHFRISFATKNENLQKAIEILNKIAKQK